MKVLSKVQEPLQALGHVTLRINRHVDHLNVGCGSPELAAGCGERRQRYRAYCRARGVPEGEQHDLATQAADGQLVSVGPLQGEIRRWTRWVERSGLECGRRSGCGSCEE